MESDDCLIVIGCTGHFHHKEGGIAVESEGVKDYLEEINQNFNYADFYTLEGKEECETTEQLEIDRSRLHTQSYTSLQSFIADFIKNTRSILLDYREKECQALIFVPDLFSFMISIPILVVSDDIYLYYMSDTNKIDWGEETWLDKLKKVLYKRMDKLLLRHSSKVLYRDELVRSRSNRPDSVFIRSKPIISFDVADIYDREDTCTGGRITLLYVGSLTVRKKVSDLIKSLSDLVKENEGQYELIIVGSGEKRTDLEQLTRKLNIEEQVKFEGQITDHERLLSLYRKSDIFVLSSSMEGFPRVLVEAMSQSLPIITTDVGEISQRITEDEAVLIPPHSPDRITQAVKHIVNSPEKRRYMIKSGNEKVLKIISESAASQHSGIIKNGSE